MAAPDSAIESSPYPVAIDGERGGRLQSMIRVRGLARCGLLLVVNEEKLCG
jgi:hypothetical protein